MRSAVLALKHRSHDEMARALGRALAAVISAETWADDLDVVTFVPSHLLRRLRTGPAAAQELARAVASSLDLPAARLLVRRGFGRQAARTRAQRLRLGANVFRAVGPVPARVLLVDDVLTTGTTLRRAVQAVLAAGATEVYCGVVARTPDPRRPT